MNMFGKSYASSMVPFEAPSSFPVGSAIQASKNITKEQFRNFDSTLIQVANLIDENFSCKFY